MSDSVVDCDCDRKEQVLAEIETLALRLSLMTGVDAIMEIEKLLQRLRTQRVVENSFH